MLRALVSIHDVMPETRRAVTDMLTRLHTVDTLSPQTITLLVVPGKDWQPDDIRWLQNLAAQGHPLAGHGWHHEASPHRTLFHRIHSALLSRNAAEHLSRTDAQLQTLVQNNHQWFAQQDLPAPALYVPPAWANGALQWQHWAERPFQWLETLTAVHDLSSANRIRLPLAGYEADTPLRAYFLRAFNQLNFAYAQHSGKPIRIGLHPFDLTYALAHNALHDLNNVDHFVSYTDLAHDLTA